MPISGATLATIYNNIINEKNNMTNLAQLTPISSFQNLLQNLTTTSQVDEGSLLFYCVAYNEWLLEQNLINLYNQLDLLSQRTGYGSSSWLCEQALLFQINSILQINPITYALSYPTTDTTLQVVGYASAQETDTGILMKIRGKNVNVIPTEQFNEFTAYINKIKILGQRISIINDYPDLLKIYGTVIYNAQVNLSTIQTNINNAITNYLSNLNFNSIFYTSNLIQVILNVEGVYDFQYSSIQGTPTTPFNYVNIVGSYTTLAGYMTIDPAFPLSGTITYQAQ